MVQAEGLQNSGSRTNGRNGWWSQGEFSGHTGYIFIMINIFPFGCNYSIYNILNGKYKGAAFTQK
jgi:hypothetical protein